MKALTLLLERQSTAALASPGPEGPALDVIVQAAFRVPDFQRLRPYKFFVARGEGRDRLGAMMKKAAIDSGQDEKAIKRAPGMPLRAPVVIVVAAIHRPDPVVPNFEQQLTAGCAVMAMQMAAVAQGFGGIWRSGWPMADRNLHAALGLADDDQIVGFLYLGTPTKTPPRPDPPDISDFVEYL